MDWTVQDPNGPSKIIPELLTDKNRLVFIIWVWSTSHETKPRLALILLYDENEFNIVSPRDFDNNEYP
jgi:hypothetical protein